MQRQFVALVRTTISDGLERSLSGMLEQPLSIIPHSRTIRTGRRSQSFGTELQDGLPAYSRIEVEVGLPPHYAQQ